MGDGWETAALSQYIRSARSAASLSAGVRASATCRARMLYASRSGSKAMRRVSAGATGGCGRRCCRGEIRCAIYHREIRRWSMIVTDDEMTDNCM